MARGLLAGDRLIVVGQVIHRHHDAVEAAPRHVEIARTQRTDRDHDRIVIRTQLLPRRRGTNLQAASEFDPFGLHEREATIDDVTLNKMDYYVEGVQGKLPSSK